MSTKFFERLTGFLERKEVQTEARIESAISEVKSINTPEKMEKREFTAGSTINVRQLEHKRLSFDHWAKTVVNGHQDYSTFSEFVSEQLIVEGLGDNRHYESIENHVRLLWNLAGEPDSQCCRWHRNVISKDGAYYLQCTLIVWRNLNIPPPKILRDGAAIKLTNREGTYDYVCKGRSYSSIEGR